MYKKPNASFDSLLIFSMYGTCGNWEIAIFVCGCSIGNKCGRSVIVRKRSGAVKLRQLYI